MSNPRLSIIVPIHKVQGYLTECLESLVDQDFTNIEIIGIDDCSPDGSGEILDEFAARDPRVKAIHLEKNVGLGSARNVGMEHATGDYLFFLDSDDTITPGSLTKIVRRLDETDDPDILIFDYARTYWWGKVARNSLASVFQSGAPDVFTALEQPRYMDLMMVVWNKVYRRDFVAEHGFAFPSGYYEDTPWTFPVMIKARTISSLDQIVVYYRQRRQGSILRTVSRKHFDIFTQYQRVFDVIDADPDLAVWRPWIFRTMVQHILSILNKKSRVPADARSEFFAETSRMFREHKPADYAMPGGSYGLKHRLIERDQYWLFQILKLMLEFARARRKQVRTALRATKGRWLRAVQWWNLKLPQKNVAVYSAYWHRGYTCNPAAIYEKARELAPDIDGVFVVRADQLDRVPAGVKTVSPGTRKYWKTVARAKYLVNNANFEDALVKRPGSIHLQTHHGTPLKHMGLDMIGYPTAAKGTDFNELLHRCDRWDFSISSNRHSSLKWERAYPANYEHIEAGYPRNDRLITATPEDVDSIRARIGIPAGKKAILYAPTHRDYNYAYVPQLDFEKIAAELGDEYVFLLRTHYFYRSNKRSSVKNPAIIDVTTYDSTEELELAADVLITDYSSIAFDYANLDRPVVVYADDWTTYAELRGVYFDLMTKRPGHIAHNSRELIDIFTSRRLVDEESHGLRASFRREFCQFDDGLASERVVRSVLLEEPKGALPYVPLDQRLSAERRAQDAARWS